MYINELMSEKKMDLNALCRATQLPESTLRHILNGTSRIERCEAITLMAIAQALHTTVEEIVMHSIHDTLNEKSTERGQIVLPNDPVYAFYDFTDHLNEMIGHGSDIDLCLFIKNNHCVERFYNSKSYSIALFLVGFSDYVCRKYKMKPFHEYERYRYMRMKSPIYPMKLFNPDIDYAEFEQEKNRVQTYAIPELCRMNIFMTEKDIRKKV